MTRQERPETTIGSSLKEAASLSPEKLLNPEALTKYGGITADAPVLVVLSAGKGTRFGREPKCIQPVHGTPLARHSMDAFRRVKAAPVISLVGYRHEDVSSALGDDNIYVLSDNPAGGTAFAAYEAFSVPGLSDINPLLIITMGDRIVPSSIYRRLWEHHSAQNTEADLTLLTAEYEPPRNRGKGRIVRGEDQCITRIVEERDILAEEEELTRKVLLDLTEGNCPLYAIRAATLQGYLQELSNNNAQGQFYITDIIHKIHRAGGEIRSITTTLEDPEYDLLCSDVTKPSDLALIEGILSSTKGLASPEEIEIEEAAEAIMAGRPAAQVASIARQLEVLLAAIRQEDLEFKPGRSIGIGISGGRLRIAFMHPDMGRFFGPAWQMPIGAGSEEGDEQIVVLLQGANDHRIHLFPTAPEFRESVNFISADTDVMYPGEEIADLHAYEEFGTRMSENLLLSLGYFNDDELNRRRESGQPLPPSSRRVGSNMRRPFALIGNAIASLRTLHSGNLGAKVKKHLGRENFQGLKIVTTGNIPQGGFSSSSAVTLAAKNALNSLFNFGIPADLLVHLACQAEYGTGVCAGSLDQATEQKGKSGQGTLLSSNPRDNYRIIAAYPVPTDRIRIIFPYSVERDRDAWRWSFGAYAETAGADRPTTGEMRKMTGKAAEIAAILTRLPLSTDFFKEIEDDLLKHGALSEERRVWVCGVLRQLPLLATQEELRARLNENRDWYVEDLMEANGLSRKAAQKTADATFESLFSGWRDPRLRRTTLAGEVVDEEGAPLRALVAYLFGEVAKNFSLIHHPDQWIHYVTRSQRGDCCIHIDPDKLPTRAEMESELPWEEDVYGPERLDCWLRHHDATPFDYNRGLDDASLSETPPPELHLLEGSNFFRGLALVDLAEAMLTRAFGADATAVRVNAAGQGDYFQVHVDTEKAEPEDVKKFIQTAFYRRFNLAPAPPFVELHPGSGALGLRLNRYDALPQLIRRLRRSEKS
jgi:GTP:adenosylcobinamide-phosphate guanylyltransferase